MARYVDGFVIPIPEGNVEAYKKMASQAGKVWMKHGALEFVECVGEDLAPDMGEHEAVTFPQIAQAKPGETVLFSFVVFRSRAHRDEVNAKVMQDPEISAGMDQTTPMPFEVKRMAYGGFSAIVDYNGESPD